VTVASADGETGAEVEAGPALEAGADKTCCTTTVEVGVAIGSGSGSLDSAGAALMVGGAAGAGDELEAGSGHFGRSEGVERNLSGNPICVRSFHSFNSAGLQPTSSCNQRQQSGKSKKKESGYMYIRNELDRCKRIVPETRRAVGSHTQRCPSPTDGHTAPVACLCDRSG
jgi:hypothetical protein